MSKKFTLDYKDWKSITRNALIFIAPAILVLLADILKALPNWVEGPYLVVAMWLINTLVDVIRKFIGGK